MKLTVHYIDDAGEDVYTKCLDELHAIHLQLYLDAAGLWNERV